MPAAYNEYVLTTALHQGWINNDQHGAAESMLATMPTVSALGFLHEQGLLTDEQAASLRNAIAEAERTHAHAHEDHPVAEVAAAATPGIQVIESGGHRFEHVNDYLHYGFSLKASDVHLGPDAPPICRVNGRMEPMFPGSPLLRPDETERLARGFLLPRQIKVVEEIGSVDFCYDVEGLARMRCSVVRQRRGWESVFRIISTRVRTMEDLALPEVMYTMTRYHNGLILVTGPVGSGKSTTLASMVQQINVDRHDHIITLEDPIEYVFTAGGCQVSQREVHTHTDSFSAALRASLREDPDVIMVGEMRDLETIALAITASETGHLVLGTLHTGNASRTLDRLLDVFPVSQQGQIRTMVSESIRGIVSQQLIPRADGNGRVMALEVMTNTPAVANLIREAKTFMLPGVMQTGKKQGMKLMDDSLMELFQKGLITQEEAYNRCENKKVFAQAMAQAIQ